MYEGQPDENILNQFESSLTRYLEVKVIQLGIKELRVRFLGSLLTTIRYTETMSEIQRYRIKNLQDMIKLLKEHFLPEDLAVHIIDHLFNLQMMRRSVHQYIKLFNELIEVIDTQAMSDLMKRRLFERGLPVETRVRLANQGHWLGGESTIVNLNKMITSTRLDASQIKMEAYIAFRYPDSSSARRPFYSYHRRTTDIDFGNGYQSG
eukprot:GHVS01101717.1.p1 GENE.GHVS01101717.1~~GHVS01101717.1.p1  ORF type:complete len:207 (+),score=6.47 GHVS01101717.1:260-880(+)